MDSCLLPQIVIPAAASSSADELVPSVLLSVRPLLDAAALLPVLPPLQLQTASLAPVALTSAEDPFTAFDQYMLEIINRARANPAAEAARFGIDLNEGLDPGTISTAAKQPLAPNADLARAAQGHSQWMLDTDTFSHTGANGSDPKGRMTAAGYSFLLPNASGENISLRTSSGNLNLTTVTALMHSDLFIDEGIEDRGHRTNLMFEDFKEIGLGVLPGEWETFNAAIVTEDFAFESDFTFLTGVAYTDTVLDDDFYTPGEGLGGVTIQATRTSNNAVFTTTTGSAGGYSLALAPGTYNIVASGGGLSSNITFNGVVIADLNIKRDFVPGQGQIAAPEITVLRDETTIVDGQGAAVTIGPGIQGAAAPTATFTVRNDGNQPLTLGAITLPAGFSLLEGLTSPLAPSASDTFTIQLSTATLGTFTGQLSFSTNDTDENPFNFPLSGSVTAAPTGAEISVTLDATNIADGQTTAIDFGSVQRDQAGPTRTFTIHNTGDQNLSFTNISFPGGFSIVENITTPLAPGASDDLTIRLNSTTAGTFTGNISITNSDSNENPFDIPVTGIVTEPVTLDAFENDNAAVAASPILTTGAPQTHSINPIGDHDYVTFTLAERSNVTIATNGPAGDTLLTLFGPSNASTLITSDDDAGPGNFSLIQRTGASALAAGTYWVEARQYLDNATIAEYTISVSATPASTTTATTLLPGGHFTFTDANASLVTIKFTGKVGSAVITRAVAADQPGDIVSIALDGTDAKSALSITAKGGSDLGVTTIGTITGDDPMGTLTGKTVDLTGAGLVMTGAGSFNTISLRDLRSGADITLPGLGAIKGLALTVGQVDDGTLINVASPLKSFTANAFNAAGSITAPWLGTLTTKTNTARALTGDFRADLNLSGASLPTPTAKTLGSAKLAGKLLGGTWDITGNSGAISAAEILPAFTLTATGTVAGLSSRSDLAGNIEALALTSLSATRDFYDATVNLHQTVVPGSAKITALGKLTVGRWMDNVTLRSAGSLGALSVGGLLDTTIFAGINPTTTDLPTTAQDFASQATIASLKMKGVKNQPDPHSFINSNIAAANLGSFALLGVERDNGAPHGLAARTIKSLTLTQPDKSKFSFPTKWLPDPGDFVVNII